MNLDERLDKAKQITSLAALRDFFRTCEQPQVELASVNLKLLRVVSRKYGLIVPAVALPLELGDPSRRRRILEILDELAEGQPLLS